MPLLSVEHVWRRYARAERVLERVALQDVTFHMEEAEMVVVWWRRRSGRTALLEVATGIDRPSEGVVRFDGTNLRQRPMLGCPSGIGYCFDGFPPEVGMTVLDQVVAPLLAGNGSRLVAEGHAYEALRRVGAPACAHRDPDELDSCEAVRVGIARALVLNPRLLVLDEPTKGIPPARDRENLLALLRSLVRREGIAILMTVAEAADLAGADRALTIDAGELRGDLGGNTGAVVPLRRRR